MAAKRGLVLSDPTLPDGQEALLTVAWRTDTIAGRSVRHADYSNLDTGVAIARRDWWNANEERENITVWVGFDGGVQPVKRRIFEGPSAYSNLGVGRAGTASQGRSFWS